MIDFDLQTKNLAQLRAIAQQTEQALVNNKAIEIYSGLRKELDIVLAIAYVADASLLTVQEVQEFCTSLAVIAERFPITLAFLQELSKPVTV